MKLIDNWPRAWRFLVVQVQIFGAAAMGAWLVMSEENKESLMDLFGLPSDKAVAVTALVVFLAGIFARVKLQPTLHKKDTQ
jgi:hypothetical protein